MKLTAISKICLCLIATLLVIGFNNCSQKQSVSLNKIFDNKGIETGNPMSSAAKLPKIFLNSDYPVLPAAHKVLTVGSTQRQFTNCQTAIDAANPGDEVVIDAGYVCSPVTLPAKGNSDLYIVIRTANVMSLPPEGVRVSKSDAAHFAVIETSTYDYAVGFADVSPGLPLASAPHHYYLLGLEMRVNAKSKVVSENIVKLGNNAKDLSLLPHDIVIARSWIHGNPSQEVRRGVGLNGLRISVIDSIIDDIHLHNATSEAIASWDAAAGPYKITNNEFAVAGTAILIGWQSSIANLIPSDIEVRNNLFHKLDAWRKPVTGNTGVTGYWAFGSPIVLRSVQRILFDANVFENDWARIPSSSYYMGRAFSLSPESFGQSWARVQDVTIINNIMHDVGGGFAISYQDAAMPEVITQRVHIENNVAYNLDPNNTEGFIWLQGQAAGSVVFNHNTFLSGANSLPIMIMGDRNGVFGQFGFTNNIINDEADGILGLSSSASGGPSLAAQFPGINFSENALAGQRASNYVGYSAANFFPIDLANIGFVTDPSGGIADFRALQLLTSSPYYNAGSDRGSIGANIQKIIEATK